MIVEPAVQYSYVFEVTQMHQLMKTADNHNICLIFPAKIQLAAIGSVNVTQLLVYGER